MKKINSLVIAVVISFLFIGCGGPEKIKSAEEKSPVFSEQGHNDKKPPVEQGSQKKNPLATHGSTLLPGGQESPNGNESSGKGTTKEGVSAWIIIGIILISGIFGGMAGFFTNRSKDQNEWRSVPKYIILGLAAAFTVPLFLNTISSNLIRDSLEKQSVENYLILAGFCLIASIYSKKFIETVWQKISERLGKVEEKSEKSEKSVKEIKEIGDVVIGKSSDEQESGFSSSAILQSLNTNPQWLNLGGKIKENTEKVVVVLCDEKFHFRTLKGIAKQANLTEGEVSLSLEELVKQGLVKVIKDSKGKPYWTLPGKPIKPSSC